GGPALEFVLVPGHGGIDSRPGGEHVHVLFAVVGETGHHFGAIGLGQGPHGDQVVGEFPLAFVVIGVIGVFGIVQVLAIVARGMDDQHILGGRVLNGIIYPFGIGGEGFAKAAINDRGPVVHGIADAQGDVLVVFVPVGNRPNAHDLHIVGHAIGPLAIVAYRGDNARNVGTVAFGVHPVLG